MICRDLRICLEDTGQKKVLFWVKNSVSWAKSGLLHGINTRLTKTFVAIFALAEWLQILPLWLCLFVEKLKKNHTQQRSGKNLTFFFHFGMSKTAV